MENNLSGLRGRQILSAIREHGPLSIKALASFLEPPTNRRRVAQAMKLLSAKGAVRKYNGSLPDNAGHHYALNITRRGREVISEILGVNPESLSYAAVAGTELKHVEQCAILAEGFRKKFPDARIVRDWELNTCPSFTQNSLRDCGGLVALPDFVIEFERSENLEPILIGVEIERTRKWADRLNKRMEALVYGTLLDGVLYVCDQFSVAEGVRRAFRRGAFSKSRRIGSYANNFILFSSYSSSVEIDQMAAVNISLDSRNICTWIESMRFVPQLFRSDQLFEPVVQRGYSK